MTTKSAIEEAHEMLKELASNEKLMEQYRIHQERLNAELAKDRYLLEIKARIDRGVQRLKKLGQSEKKIAEALGIPEKEMSLHAL
ncbi:hypothetical protein GMMP15_850020 [Candidatus Magnetomoraceae bacterium gMMP-15]